jgi:hypothetical protein
VLPWIPWSRAPPRPRAPPPLACPRWLGRVRPGRRLSPVRARRRSPRLRPLVLFCPLNILGALRPLRPLRPLNLLGALRPLRLTRPLHLLGAAHPLRSLRRPRTMSSTSSPPQPVRFRTRVTLRLRNLRAPHERKLPVLPGPVRRKPTASRRLGPALAPASLRRVGPMDSGQLGSP